MDVHAADAWRSAFPGAAVGFLALDDVANPPDHPALAEHVRQVEAGLRSRFAGAARADLLQLPVLEAYRAYYKRFDKTYHVQLQLESVLLKGKPLRSMGGALVTAMFAAEITNMLLTAGHDLDRVEGALSVAVSEGGERYAGFGGRDLTLQPGDMYIRDQAGIISSILYGPDQRTRLSENTRRAVFTVYAPQGIGTAAVEAHLAEIATNVRLAAPGARILRWEVLQ